MLYWFNFDGIDSRTMGVTMNEPVPIMRGKERVQRQTIPGREGTLTLTEGANIYDPYVQTLKISVRGAANVPRVKKWLRGRHYVIFHTEPDRRQIAAVENEIKLEKLSRNLDVWQGVIQFYCDPLKEPLAQATEELTAGLYTNIGDAVEKPILIFDGNGDTTFTVDGKAFTLTGIPDGGCIVDCNAKEVLTADGTRTITEISGGDFPEFPEGISNVSWTQPNIGSITVTVVRRVVYL